MADPGHLRFARELEERDAAIAGALAQVRELQADVEELRAHATATAAFRARFPEEQARAVEAVAEAEHELHAREADVAAAEAELAEAKEGEARAAAERAVTRTRDAAGQARRRLARAQEEREALERQWAETEADLPRQAARAAELAGRLNGAPRATRVPPAADTLDWTSRARASLFSAAASLETERERVVREANELAAAAFGDPAYATSVSVVRQRLEREAP